MHPRDLLRTYGLSAFRKRGQNFLINPEVSRRIIEIADIRSNDIVMEVGAGFGALTMVAAKKSKFLMAVDIDRGICAVLLDLLVSGKVRNVDLWCADILKLNWTSLLDLYGGNINIIGNLPYYIISPFLILLVKFVQKWRRATLMLQEEVAVRILARPGTRKYGLLSVLIQTIFELRSELKLKNTNFFPQPKVFSRVISLTPLSRPFFKNFNSEKILWYIRVIKAAFSQRRKFLKNSLTHALKWSSSSINLALMKADIDPLRRAETLEVSEFVKLSEILLRIKSSFRSNN